MFFVIPVIDSINMLLFIVISTGTNFNDLMVCFIFLATFNRSF